MPGTPKKEIRPKALTDAQLAASLKKENSQLQEQLAAVRQEQEKAAAREAAAAKAREAVAAELAAMQSRTPALAEVNVEPQSLWQALKRALEKNSGLERRLEELAARADTSESAAAAASRSLADLQERLAEQETARKILEQERDAASQGLAAAGAQLKAVISREQNNQIKAMAEAAELKELLETGSFELRELRDKQSAAEKNWEKERAALQRSLERAAAERDELAAALAARQHEEEEFARALPSLQEAIPALREVEARPESVLRGVLKELLLARESLGAISALEEKLAAAEEKIIEAHNLDQRLGKLLAENRRLQEERDALAENSEIFATQATAGAELLREKCAAAMKEAEARAAREQEVLRKNLALLETENRSLLTQLQSNGKVAFVGAERVSLLLDDLYTSMESSLKGLDVRESEVRLKVGFAGLSGEEAGFVIPTAGNAQEFKEGLGEIVLRLGRKES
jgi:hypothetical protein